MVNHNGGYNSPNLIGGFNPIEKSWATKKVSPNRTENKTSLKPPPSYIKG